MCDIITWCMVFGVGYCVCVCVLGLGYGGKIELKREREIAECGSTLYLK